MGNSLNSTLKGVVKEYLKEDEEMVKNLKQTKEKITFFFDVIDEDIPVTVNILEDNVYEYRYKKVRETMMDPNFEDFIKMLFDDLYDIRNKKIAFYNSMETPISPDDDVDRFPKKEEVEDYYDSEEEEEDFILTVSTPSLITDPNKIFEDEIIRKKIIREPLYEILTPEQLITQQSQLIKSLSDNTGISKAASMIILREFGWDKEKVISNIQKNGKEEILKKVGLGVSSNILKKKEEEEENEGEEETEDINPNAEFECPSCYDDVKYKETLKIDSCHHRFCNNCWKDQLTYKIKDGLSKRILCMGSDCPCVVDENIVSSYITDPELKKKYDQKLLESFVEDNNLMKWCQSAPHCGNACMINSRKLKDIQNVGSIPYEIHCLCRNSIFCFSCLDHAHNPASCKMLQEWRKKCSDDSETLNWIKANTRDCPQCHKATEKNEGCNHISCTCGAHWCWACGGNFNTNTVYSHQCNRYLEQDGASSNGDQTRVSLERYLHYFNHYNVHQTSFKNQIKMQMRTNQKVKAIFRRQKKEKKQELQHPSVPKDRDDNVKNIKLEDLDFLRDGLNVLFDTRRVLMHSYVFAYFLFEKKTEQKDDDDNNNVNNNLLLMKGCRKFESEKERVRAKNLFEDTQEQLELTVESLNLILDLPLEQILERKKEVIASSIICEKRIHGLFDVLRSEMMMNSKIELLPEPRFIVTKPGEYEDNEYDLSTFGFLPSTIPEGTFLKKMEHPPPKVTYSAQGFLATLMKLVQKKPVLQPPTVLNSSDGSSTEEDEEEDWDEEDDDLVCIVVKNPIKDVIFQDSTSLGYQNVIPFTNFASSEDGFIDVKISKGPGWIKHSMGPLKEVGNYDTTGGGFDVFMEGNIVFVADDYSGLKIYNITDRTKPKLISGIQTYRAHGITVSGEFAYVADHDDGLKIIDISVLISPKIIATAFSSESFRVVDVFFQDNYCYCADERFGLRVVDVSNKTNPILIASVGTIQAYRIQIKENFAYMACGSYLSIVNISVPQTPYEISTNLPMVDARSLAINDNLIFVSGMQDVLVVNVSNIKEPLLVVEYSLTVEGYADISFQSPYFLYVLDMHGLKVYTMFPFIEVSNLGWPITRIFDARISVSEEIGFALDPKGSFRIIKTSNPFVPIEELGILGPIGESFSSFVEDHYCYIADGGAGLRIIDFSTPESPVEIGQYALYDGDEINPFLDVVVADNLAYITQDNRGVVVLDVSDKSSPSFVNLFEDFIPMKNPSKIAVDGNFLFVTDDSLQILNITDKRNPVFVGQFVHGSGSGTVNSVFVLGDYAYIAMDSTNIGFGILDISDIEYPNLISGGYIHTTHGYEVVVQGDYAYLSDKKDLKIIDISTKDDIAIVGTFDANNAIGVAVAGNYTFIADGSSGLKIIDVSDKTEPKLLNTFSLNGEARDVKIEGNMIYVTFGDSGVAVLEFGDLVLEATVPYYSTFCESMEITIQAESNEEVVEDSFSFIFEWIDEKCGGHGVCGGSDGICDCDPNYSSSILNGPCDDWYCFSKKYSDHDVCRGKGECAEPQNCKCNFGYSGSECGTNLVALYSIIGVLSTILCITIILCICCACCCILVCVILFILCFCLSSACLLRIICSQRMGIMKYQELRDFDLLLKDPQVRPKIEDLKNIVDEEYPSIVEVVVSCWNHNPEERFSFDQIKEYFEKEKI